MQTSTDAGDLPIDVPHIVSERLGTDIDYFAYVFDLLTDGNIRLNSEYLRCVSALGKVNAAKGGERSAVQVMEEWLPWHRTLFDLFIRDHPSLQVAYQSFGYRMAGSSQSRRV